jgi:hypothetical protein
LNIGELLHTLKFLDEVVYKHIKVITYESMMIDIIRQSLEYLIFSKLKLNNLIKFFNFFIEKAYLNVWIVFLTKMTALKRKY